MLNKILVVDDEKIIRDILVRLLSAKFDVSTASDGKEAVQKIGGLKPDLVFLDMLMPGLNGMDLLKEVLKISPGINVVIMTGLASDDAKKAALEGGARGYLSKPFSIGEIEKCVDGFINE